MSREYAQFSLRRVRLLTLIVMIVVVAAITLANLSAEAVSVELIDSNKPERGYGWPLTCYWRSASSSPGNILLYHSRFNNPMAPAAASPLRLQWHVSRYSGYCLAANLAIWLLLLAASSVGCEWLLHRYRPRLHRWPRLSTVVVLMIVSVPTLFANLSFDAVAANNSSVLTKASFGWPLVWYWHVVMARKVIFLPVRGWDYSATRLAANLVICLLMLAVVGFTWEWLLRRHRPRLRFSLQTMLAVVGLVALLCAWCAADRNRAKEQDALIAWAGDDAVFVERWGPKWLDLVGADRFRRRVVGARLDLYRSGEADEAFLRRLGQLPDLRYLDIFSVSDLTPGMAAALADMRQLRMLRIDGPGDEEAARQCLAWVGKLTQLERLWLHGWSRVRRDDLACLSGLTNLNSLALNELYCDKKESHEWLAAVGNLTQLEQLCLKVSDVRSEDLAYLGGLTNLKSLTLETTDFDEGSEVAHEFLAAVGKLTHLERLRLAGCLEFRSDDLATLGGLANLKSLTLPEDADGDNEETEKLAHLPVLLRLEVLDLHKTLVGDQDIRRLAGCPRLKSLNLDGTLVTDAGMGELAPLESLEELSIDQRVVITAGLESLVALKRLRAVHIPYFSSIGVSAVAEVRLDDGLKLAVLPSEVSSLLGALMALRQSHPGIVIDRDDDAFPGNGDFEPPWQVNSDQTAGRGSLHSFVRQCIDER